MIRTAWLPKYDEVVIDVLTEKGYDLNALPWNLKKFNDWEVVTNMVAERLPDTQPRLKKYRIQQVTANYLMSQIVFRTSPRNHSLVCKVHDMSPREKKVVSLLYNKIGPYYIKISHALWLINERLIKTKEIEPFFPSGFRSGQTLKNFIQPNERLLKKQADKIARLARSSKTLLKRTAVITVNDEQIKRKNEELVDFAHKKLFKTKRTRSEDVISPPSTVANKRPRRRLPLTVDAAKHPSSSAAGAYYYPPAEHQFPYSAEGPYYTQPVAHPSYAAAGAYYPGAGAGYPYGEPGAGAVPVAYYSAAAGAYSSYSEAGHPSSSAAGAYSSYAPAGHPSLYSEAGDFPTNNDASKKESNIEPEALPACVIERPKSQDEAEGDLDFKYVERQV
ncbi:MAG: hypothetical protein P0S95_05470 [Rhabdochlamydiaceae bacterium]|nr:hypothetical protein [Candidatus Amphrikana amoebophyrae]